MSSNGSRRVASNILFEWQNDERLQDIHSFVGSDIEFVEKSFKRQLVVGTLDKCDNNSFNLINATINGSYFGDYVINDYEIHKWRLRMYRQIHEQHRNGSANSNTLVEDSSKYLIPNRLQEEEEHGIGGEDELLKRFVEQSYVREEVEIVDLNEDEDQIVIDLESLTLRASNTVIFIRQIDEDFHETIQKIKNSNSVGFKVFGEEITRNGSIDLMAFAIPDAIYVFDTKNKDIVVYLKPLLESEELQKVMFAVRHPSDALHHLFGIELNNAVDVRIWDFCQQKKRFVSTQLSAKPELRSYEKIVWLYLRVKVPKLFRNLDFRHFSAKIENFIRVYTIFLRELFVLINHKLLEDVYQMNSRCIRSLRSAEGLEYVAVRSDDRELEIIDNPNICCEEAERHIIGMASYKPFNGFKGKEVNVRSSDEILIQSDEELDEIVLLLYSVL